MSSKFSMRKSAATTVAILSRCSWVDKIKGDVCRSKLVCREIEKAKKKR